MGILCGGIWFMSLDISWMSNNQQVKQRLLLKWIAN
jgi:hypothetical protein